MGMHLFAGVGRYPSYPLGGRDTDHAIKARNEASLSFDSISTFANNSNVLLAEKPASTAYTHSTLRLNALHKIGRMRI